MALAAALAGCGGTASTAPAVSNLEREDLLSAVRALHQAQPQIAREAAASRRAWRLVANGLPKAAGAAARAKVAAAAAGAAAVELPPLFDDYSGRRLAGPAASLAGLFRGYERLNTPAWRALSAALELGASGSATSARFARANSPLYVDSVYDAHFALAQLGHKLQAAYTDLGGEHVFQQSLTPAEVSELAAAFSEQQLRLHPHAGVRLGA